jgi:hypothetical protein
MRPDKLSEPCPDMSATDRTDKPPSLEGAVRCPVVRYDPSKKQTDRSSASEPTILPRLFNLRQAAAYMNLSYWTMRDYVLAGFVPTVDMPGLRPRLGATAKASLRRVLVDVRDLDAFVDSLKRRAQDESTCAPTISRDESTTSGRGVPVVCPPRGRR